MTEHVCTCARIDGWRITRADCPIHPMPQRRPAREDPLRLTFTREELDEAMAAARDAGAQEVRAKVLALPDEMAVAWGGDASWLTTGNKVAGLVWGWLNEALADGGDPQ